MGKIRTQVQGKEVILLGGAFPYADPEADPIAEPVDLAGGRMPGERAAWIERPDKLIEAARRDPDAVAFGYFAGRWIAAA